MLKSYVVWVVMRIGVTHAISEVVRAVNSRAWQRIVQYELYRMLSVGLAIVRTTAGVAVQSVVPNVSAGTITIHLNKAPSQAVTVGWDVPN